MALPVPRTTAEPPPQATDDELIARWIEPDPHYPAPDRARIADHAVSVTAVITQLRLAHGDRAAAARAYELPSEAIDAALAYYHRHRAVIDARITLNVASFPDDTIGLGNSPEDTLIARWVETAPAFPTPDQARIVDHGVSVTAVISQLQLAGGTSEAQQAYGLPPEAIAAALAYYHRHRAVIDARITLDATSFAE